MATSVVGGVTPKTGLTIRPDLLIIPFSLRVQGGDPALLDLVRGRLDKMLGRFKAATGGGGEARVNGLSKEHGVDPETRERIPTTRVDGCLEVPLTAAQDYWARAKLSLAIAQAIDDMRSMDAESQPLITAAFDDPRATVADPERYREQLTVAWVARMRKFVALAQSESAPLEIVECSPPTEILETRISIEEVVLDLKPSCKLDVLARRAERQH